MNCENYLCVYENHGKCSLKNITLDVLGQCANCIYVKLTDEELERAKKRTIDFLETATQNPA